MTRELLFVPLGGVGEIGLNVYLYGLNGRWMMVELGLTFADDRLPGAELVLPDLTFIEQQRDKLDGIVLTHAHEDHLGAVPYLWPKLDVPLYCTRFPAAVLRRKFEEGGLTMPSPIREVKPGEAFDVGPFACRFAHVTHSIPEANALAIETPFGRLLHTGDWKLDPTPLVGDATDIDLLERFGKEGVLALIGDSTNAMNPGTSGSESEVRDSLRELIAAQPNRVALTTFASNIARLETAILAGVEAGREVVVVGRSMRRMLEAARESGYLKDLPALRDEREAEALPRNRVLLLVTGSQGEPRAALMRIAGGQHPRVRLEPGDTAIFSSKIIPGNERTLYDLHNRLVDQGVEVITEEDHFVHVSGHPSRDEMEQMYRWLKPRYAVPIHGEARHLHAHARLAKSLGIEKVLSIRNGDMLRLAPGEPGVTGEVPTGRMVLETSDLVAADDDLYRTRRRLMNHGTVVVSLVLDRYGSLLAAPKLSAIGAVELGDYEKLREEAGNLIGEAIEDLDDDEVGDDTKVIRAARTALKEALGLPRTKRPILEFHITRLTPETMAELEDEPAGAAP